MNLVVVKAYRQRSTELRMRLTMLLKPCRFLTTDTHIHEIEREIQLNSTNTILHNEESVERGRERVSVCCCFFLCTRARGVEEETQREKY